MDEMRSMFADYFEKQDKSKCVELCLEWLSAGKLTALELYENILTPVLNEATACADGKQLCIWREHVATAIARTIIECAYPYVIKERDAQGFQGYADTAVVLCPDGEYHEIGARIVTDYLTLNGYNAVFVGSSTPKQELVNAIEVLKPGLIAISVTNYYNIIAAKKLIVAIREKLRPGFTVIAGGQAFSNNPLLAQEIGADDYVRGFNDLKKLLERIHNGGEQK